MSKLTQEKIDVLDKLYNIKGEKSVVTAAIKTKIEKKDISNKFEAEFEEIKKVLASKISTTISKCFEKSKEFKIWRLSYL